MGLWTFAGQAHICFLPPINEDSVHCCFAGHGVSSSSSDRIVGIAGRHLPNHIDTHRNDCMDPQVFYEMKIKDYERKKEYVMLVRRAVLDDAAGFGTDPVDDEECNKGMTCRFETEKFLVGDKALAHCKKYLGDIAVEKEDVVVCMGHLRFTIPLDNDDGLSSR